MKACVLEAVGQLVYKEVPTPEPKAGEVLLKVRACGICSSDIDRVYKTGTYHFPTIPGHEFAGEIVEVGEGVDAAYLGKRAAVFPLLPCFECESCKNELYVHCSHYGYFGSRQDGAFAEYLAVPLWNIIPFDDTLPFSEAALCEPTAVAMHACDKATITPDTHVAVIGSGTIGIIIALRAQQLGAKSVTLVGTRDKKLDFVHEMGITSTVNSSKEDVPEVITARTDGRGADVVFECVGTSDSVESSVLTAAKSGQVVVVGNPAGDMTMPRNSYWKILRNELTLTGMWNSSYNSQVNDWKTALDFMAHGSADFSKLVTHAFDLSEHEAAFDAVRDRDTFTIKVMLTNDN